jgi:hypothetical protein
MIARGALRPALSALLWLALVGLSVDLARRSGWSLELGRQRLTAVSEEERALLRSLPHPVRATYYVSPSDELPSHMRRMEREVTAVLAGLAQAAPERFSFEVCRPDRDPARIDFAVARRLAPVNVRSVARDAYTDRELWSTLELATGPHDPAVIEGLGPESLPRLRALVLAHVRELGAPSRPRVAFAAPEGFDRLRQFLADRCDVIDVDLDAGQALPERSDLLVWMQPAGPAPETLAQVERYRSEGRAVWIAASARSGALVELGGRPALDLAPRGLDAQALWEPFGLGAVDPPLLDPRCEALLAGSEQIPLPFLLRCIAPNQDFRDLAEQPNGNLLFATPTPFALDGEALREHGLEARVLATSSDQAWLATELAGGDDPPPTALDQLTPERGRKVAKQALLVRLEPRAGFGGPLFAASSTSPFADEFFDLGSFAHRKLAEILFAECTRPERLVAARADIERAQRIERPGPAAELTLRGLVTLAGPLLLALAGLLGGGLRPDRRDLLSLARRLLLGLGVLGLAVGLSALAGLARGRLGTLDLSEDGLNRLHPTTHALAGSATSAGPLELEWVASQASSLPLRMRRGARELEARLAELAERHPRLELRRTVPELLDARARERLDERGIAPFRVTESVGDETTVRRVFATLTIAAGPREVRLDFPDPTAFEDFEFRLALALRRVTSERGPRIGLISDLPRLSPAEAHEEYQLRQRFAPSGTDVYSLARASLERAGFEVLHIDPRPTVGAGRLVLPDDLDALVWLQPRRDVRYALEAVSEYLHAGGRVLVCAQHFNLQAERHRGRGFELAWWPQPQSADIEELWFPEFGVTLERTVLFDALSFAAELETEVNRTAEEREYSSQDSALPFLIRVSSTSFADDPVLAGVGDQGFVWGNAIELDSQRLAANGLQAEVLFATSDRSWSHPWKGGFVPAEVLEGPLDGSFGGARPLAVDVRGRFPLPDEPLIEREQDTRLPPIAGEGRLVLVGASEPFKNRWLLGPDFRADHLLLNLVADLSLEDELAALAGRRRVPRGLALVPEPQRLRWRAIELGLPPLALLFVGLLANATRRARERSLARALTRSGA